MTRFSLFIFLSSMTMALHSCKEQEQPADMVWRVAGELPPPAGQEKAIGLAGPLAGVSNDVLLLGGGANFPDGYPWAGGKKKYYDEGFVYSRTAENELRLLKRFRLPDTLAYPASVSTPSGVVVAGGENERGALNEVFIAEWVPHRDTVEFRPLPPLPLPLANAGMALWENTLYLLGGENAQGASSGLYALDLEQPDTSWSALPPLPYAVSHAVVTIAGKEEPGLYVLGGRKKNPGALSDLYNAVWRFDLKSKSWQEQPSLPYPLCAGTGLTLAEETIYLFGGDRGETFRKTEELILAIQASTDPQKRMQLTQSKNTLQESHPGFSSEVLAYRLADKSWSRVGNLPFPTPVTTTAVNWEGMIIIPSGEVRAGVRTEQILSLQFEKEKP